MSAILKKKATEILEDLHQKDLTHLDSMIRGKQIILFSQSDGKKEYRCRFMQIEDDSFALSMFNQTGWDATPFTGSLEELLELVEDEFSWVLESY